MNANWCLVCNQAIATWLPIQLSTFIDEVALVPHPLAHTHTHTQQKRQQTIAAEFHIWLVDLSQGEPHLARPTAGSQNDQIAKWIRLHFSFRYLLFIVYWGARAERGGMLVAFDMPNSPTDRQAQEMENKNRETYV